jgi:hypothetical protein
MYSVILFNVIFILSICSTGYRTALYKGVLYFPYILLGALVLSNSETVLSYS